MGTLHRPLSKRKAQASPYATQVWTNLSYPMGSLRLGRKLQWIWIAGQPWIQLSCFCSLIVFEGPVRVAIEQMKCHATAIFQAKHGAKVRISRELAKKKGGKVKEEGQKAFNSTLRHHFFCKIIGGIAENVFLCSVRTSFWVSTLIWTGGESHPWCRYTRGVRHHASAPLKKGHP